MQRTKTFQQLIGELTPEMLLKYPGIAMLRKQDKFNVPFEIEEIGLYKNRDRVVLYRDQNFRCLFWFDFYTRAITIGALLVEDGVDYEEILDGLTAGVLSVRRRLKIKRILFYGLGSHANFASMPGYFYALSCCYTLFEDELDTVSRLLYQYGLERKLSVRELMETEYGRNVWKKIGKDVMFEFDTNEKSENTRMFVRRLSTVGRLDFLTDDALWLLIDDTGNLLS